MYSSRHTQILNAYSMTSSLVKCLIHYSRTRILENWQDDSMKSRSTKISLKILNVVKKIHVHFNVKQHFFNTSDGTGILDWLLEVFWKYTRGKYCNLI